MRIKIKSGTVSLLFKHSLTSVSGVSLTMVTEWWFSFPPLQLQSTTLPSTWLVLDDYLPFRLILVTYSLFHPCRHRHAPAIHHDVLSGYRGMCFFSMKKPDSNQYLVTTLDSRRPIGVESVWNEETITRNTNSVVDRDLFQLGAVCFVAKNETVPRKGLQVLKSASLSECRIICLQDTEVWFSWISYSGEMGRILNSTFPVFFRNSS